MMSITFYVCKSPDKADVCNAVRRSIAIGDLVPIAIHVSADVLYVLPAENASTVRHFLEGAGQLGQSARKALGEHVDSRYTSRERRSADTAEVTVHNHDYRSAFLHQVRSLAEHQAPDSCAFHPQRTAFSQRSSSQHLPLPFARLVPSPEY